MPHTAYRSAERFRRFSRVRNIPKLVFAEPLSCSPIELPERLSSDCPGTRGVPEKRALFFDARVPMDAPQAALTMESFKRDDFC
jgi:hypothetical protein